MSVPVPFLSRSSGAARDPPSFPTRRSSDLAGRAAGEELGPAAAGDRVGARAADHLFGPHQNVVAFRAAAAAVVGVPDRKSTRLNSSHLVISYAVFCLKKKKCIIDTRLSTQL